MEDNKQEKIKVTFSKNCIGADSCCCWRCIERKGGEPNQYTEMKAEIASVYQKLQASLSANEVISKSVEEKVQWLQSVLREAQMRFQNILSTDTLLNEKTDNHGNTETK